MHRCFRYVCIHLVNSFNKASPQDQAFTTVLSTSFTELTDPLTDPHTELNDLLVPGQKASQHVSLGKWSTRVKVIHSSINFVPLLRAPLLSLFPHLTLYETLVQD